MEIITHQHLSCHTWRVEVLHGGRGPSPEGSANTIFLLGDNIINEITCKIVHGLGRIEDGGTGMEGSVLSRTNCLLLSKGKHFVNPINQKNTEHFKGSGIPIRIAIFNKVAILRHVNKC